MVFVRRRRDGRLSVGADGGRRRAPVHPHGHGAAAPDRALPRAHPRLDVADGLRGGRSDRVPALPTAPRRPRGSAGGQRPPQDALRDHLLAPSSSARWRCSAGSTSGPYRIVHLAGHGQYESPTTGDGKARSGMVLDNGVFLTAVEIGQMQQVPELVFLNCCHIGQTGPEAPAGAAGTEFNRLAASISRELIEMGVRAVVAAGWAVRDDAALHFARCFYQHMLDGHSFGSALQDARYQTWRQPQFKDCNTWGAYQAYGDPDFRFDPRGLGRAARRRRARRARRAHRPARGRPARRRATSSARVATPGARAEALAQRLDAVVKGCPAEWLARSDVAMEVGYTYGELRRFEDAEPLSPAGPGGRGHRDRRREARRPCARWSSSRTTRRGSPRAAPAMGPTPPRSNSRSARWRRRSAGCRSSSTSPRPPSATRCWGAPTSGSPSVHADVAAANEAPPARGRELRERAPLGPRARPLQSVSGGELALVPGPPGRDRARRATASSRASRPPRGSASPPSASSSTPWPSPTARCTGRSPPARSRTRAGRRRGEAAHRHATSRRSGSRSPRPARSTRSPRRSARRAPAAEAARRGPGHRRDGASLAAVRAAIGGASAAPVAPPHQRAAAPSSPLTSQPGAPPKRAKGRASHRAKRRRPE